MPGPSDFHFGQHNPVTFMEVDWWFNALPPPGTDNPDPRTDADHWEEKLRECLALKRYVQPGRHYLVLCIHRSFIFEGKPA